MTEASIGADAPGVDRAAAKTAALNPSPVETQLMRMPAMDGSSVGMGPHGPHQEARLGLASLAHPSPLISTAHEPSAFRHKDGATRTSSHGGPCLVASALEPCEEYWLQGEVLGQASRAHVAARRGALSQRLLHGIHRLVEERRAGGGDVRQALHVEPAENE